ncbi:uncharacterized protein C8Q71DRAFT_768540 [Rhodofomes roseus]|uniref:Uncharacterized protein n=1 Tax=Rhodofomes roseus TaxID=34475 RepID=A0ABQ8KAA4_9APHY|nr:uncharacterized protein C8Q71DRAFT_768540 [Rhodofomes roseus]KAH9834395.1 hypothetical protein C8Q71DRAFT_768540 [Rhodofomes roseus]
MSGTAASTQLSTLICMIHIRLIPSSTAEPLRASTTSSTPPLLCRKALVRLFKQQLIINLSTLLPMTFFLL